MLLSHIDHVTVAVKDLDAAVAAHAALLGNPPLWLGSHPEFGTVSALFGLGNTTLELVAPGRDDERTAGLRAWLDEYGEGLQSLAFAAPDVDALRPVLRERGIPVTAPQEGEARGRDGTPRTYRAIELSSAATRGLSLLVVQRDDAEALRRVPTPADDGAEALDHVVVHSAAPDAAVALYQDRLGLRLALDRVVLGVRMLFFRVGGVTFEVVEDADRNEPDRLWGLAYRVRDIQAAHARLEAAGLSLSSIRDGHKAGTHTFTVEGGVCGVPTLIIRDPTRD